MEFSIKIDICKDKLEGRQKKTLVPQSISKSPCKAIHTINTSIHNTTSTSPFQDLPAFLSTPEINTTQYNSILKLQKKFEEPGLSIFHIKNLRIKEKLLKSSETAVYTHIYKQDENIQNSIDYYKAKLLRKQESSGEKFVLNREENKLSLKNGKKVCRKLFRKSENFSEEVSEVVARPVRTPGVEWKKYKELIPLTKARMRLNRTVRPSSREMRETLKNYRLEFVGK